MINYKMITKDTPIIAWWSGGIASAITCNLCISWFGTDKVRIIFIDTNNEDSDTYRFLKDCESWYGIKIETITSKNYKSIQDVWIKNLSLNTATGAICSTELKKIVREDFQKNNSFSYQAFGFDIEEIDRAMALKLNHPDSKPIFPLIYELLNKKACLRYLPQGLFKIEVPIVYKLGYLNNNCFNTGCVQGGIGYWQKIQKEDENKFNAMAEMEHRITKLKGIPVTMLKDQSKKGGLVFLKHNPDYPTMKDITMMKGRKIESMIECNGYCGLEDFNKSKINKEINYQTHESK